jgi:ABC-type sugar transport system ATPase subunit
MASISDETAWLQVRGLGKHFGGVSALKGVNLDVRRGEVHGLVGANGAGKSTLIRCLAGVITADSGEVLIDGQQNSIHSPRDAENLGFAFIHQELNLIPRFNSVQNILLGAQKAKRAGFIDWKESRRMAEAAAARIGLEFSLDTPVAELSVADRWLVMISKALVNKASLIAMDEPTASLSVTESNRLFKIIRDLSADGVAILYVSHRLEEVLDLANRITVFRDGEVVTTGERSEWTKESLIRDIVGRDVVTSSRPHYRPRAHDQTPIFEAFHVSRGHVVKDVSLQVYPGEILGLGGVVGSGRTEFARLVFGVDRVDSGEFAVDGKPFVVRSATEAIAKGIGLVPEERRSEGLLLDKSVAFNMNITVLRTLRTFTSLPFLSEKLKKDRANEIIQKLSVKTKSISAPVGSLSGGNQQKVLIAHWLTPGIKVLILDEPTKGVDVGAREEIYQAIRGLVANNVGVILISSEAEELVMLSDRVVVLRHGGVVGELVGDEISERRIIEMGFGHVSETAKGNE